MIKLLHMRITFQVSENLILQKRIMLLNQDRKLEKVRVRFRLSLLLLYLVRDIRLEYFSLNISKLGALKVAFQRFIALTGYNPRQIIKQGFFFYEVCTDNIFKDQDCLTFLGSDDSEVWTSRNAIVGGMSAPDLSRVIEYDLIRRKENSRFLIWSTSKSPRLVTSKIVAHPIFPARKLTGFYDLSANKLEVKNIKGVEVFGGKCLMIEDKHARLRATSSSYDVCWPSEIPTLIDGSLFLPQTKSSMSLKNAIYVGHSHSWYHFIVEFLPYLGLIGKYQRSSPLLIPEGCPKQIIQLIKLLGYTNIIEIAPQESVFVGNLTTVVDFKRHSFSDFSGASGINLKVVQELCLGAVPHQNLKISPRTRKVFLARGSNLLRGFSNAKQIHALLLENGYEIVFPENLSTLEQITLMNECSHIVAESGAAITSIIFSKSQINVLELRPPLGESKLFWQRFVESIGHKHRALDAPMFSNLKLSANSRTKINIRELRALLNEF